jgi:hypothetical protein
MNNLFAHDGNPPATAFGCTSTGAVGLGYTCGFTPLAPTVLFTGAGAATALEHEFRIAASGTQVEFKANGAGSFTSASTIVSGVAIPFPGVDLSVTFPTALGQEALTVWSVTEAGLEAVRTPSITCVDERGSARACTLTPPPIPLPSPYDWGTALPWVRVHWLWQPSPRAHCRHCSSLFPPACACGAVCREHTSCSDRGICDTVLGMCECDPGYSGTACAAATVAVVPRFNAVSPILDVVGNEDLVRAPCKHSATRCFASTMRPESSQSPKFTPLVLPTHIHPALYRRVLPLRVPCAVQGPYTGTVLVLSAARPLSPDFYFWNVCYAPVCPALPSRAIRLPLCVHPVVESSFRQALCEARAVVSSPFFSIAPPPRLWPTPDTAAPTGH